MKVTIKNKKITVTGDNQQLLEKVGQLIKDAIALADDIPEYVDVKEPIDGRGRPSPSCFDDEEEERKFKNSLSSLKQKMLACKYNINTVSAYISFKTIGRYSNQKYFCNLLRDAGIDVNYKIFMRELEKIGRGKGKVVIKLSNYFNHFNHQDKVE